VTEEPVENVDLDIKGGSIEYGSIRHRIAKRLRHALVNILPPYWKMAIDKSSVRDYSVMWGRRVVAHTHRNGVLHADRKELHDAFCRSVLNNVST
jgi:hypothetical protein